METELEKLKRRYEPIVAIRLACWLAIYLAASYFNMTRWAVKHLPEYNFISQLWFEVLHLPEDFQSLMVGLLGLEDRAGLIGSILEVLAYGFYLINFVLCLVLRDKWKFWASIVVLIVLIFLTFTGPVWFLRETFH